MNLKIFLNLILILSFVWTINSQTLDTTGIVSDTVHIEQNDTVPVIYLDDVVLLPHLYFSKNTTRYKYYVLRKKVLKVYPFAKMAGEDLEKLNRRLEKMTPKQRRKYKKIVERYVRNVIEPELRELTPSEGRVLVRLVYRQTGMSVYDFLKKYKSGLSAFWWQRMAKLYKIDLKEIYDPENRLEDFWMEDILVRAFQYGDLEPSPPKVIVDYFALFNKWMEKMPKNYRKRRNFIKNKKNDSTRLSKNRKIPFIK